MSHLWRAAMGISSVAACTVLAGCCSKMAGCSLSAARWERSAFSYTCPTPTPNSKSQNDLTSLRHNESWMFCSQHSQLFCLCFKWKRCVIKKHLKMGSSSTHENAVICTLPNVTCHVMTIRLSMHAKFIFILGLVLSLVSASLIKESLGKTWIRYWLFILKELFS